MPKLSIKAATSSFNAGSDDTSYNAACARLRKHFKLSDDAGADAIAAALNPPVTESAPAPVVVREAPVRIGGFSLGNIARTAATIAATRTHCDAESNRDQAYLLLFGEARDNAELPGHDGRVVTLAMLASYGSNHYYVGSNKPHDAGAINRSAKLGYIERDNDGTSFVLTNTGEALLRNLRAKRAAANA